MKTVSCLLCKAKETFDENESIFGLVVSKDYFSLSGPWQEKDFVCIPCLTKSEVEAETNTFLLARLKAAREGTKPPPFEFAVVLIITKKGERKVITLKTLKGEDLTRFIEVFGIFAVKEEAEKLRASKT